MKIEYLNDGADACPLIRLYEFQTTEVERLCRLFDDLAHGTMTSAFLEDVESIDGTQLTFALGKYDQGIVARSTQSFELVLSADSWLLLSGRLEPFCQGSSGYQWLWDVGPIQLLLSQTGTW